MTCHYGEISTIQHLMKFVYTIYYRKSLYINVHIVFLGGVFFWFLLVFFVFCFSGTVKMLEAHTIDFSSTFSPMSDVIAPIPCCDTLHAKTISFTQS